MNDIQIVNFTVGDVNYGVPVHQVREILGMQPVTPVPGTGHQILGVSNLRGQIITVMDLKSIVGIKGDLEGNRKIIWVQRNDYEVGIIVDAVTEVSTIPGDEIEDSNETGKAAQYIIGIGKQRGTLVVVLDFFKIIEESTENLLISSTIDQPVETPLI